MASAHGNQGGSLRLGDALRPIVLGRGASLSEPGIELRRPELALGVALGGRVLGYALIDQTRPPPPYGGLTTAPGISLAAAHTLMSSAALQLGLFEVPRAAHHCLLLTSPEMDASEVDDRRSEFLDAIRPLTERGLCRIVYTRDAKTLTPSLAQRGLVASASGATFAALEHLGIDVAGAQLALYREADPGRRLAEQLVRQGMRVVANGEQALRAISDVLVVDGTVWKPDRSRAQNPRARIIVMLGALIGPDSLERPFAGRGILMLPDTITTSGAILAPHLVAEGFDDDGAVAQCFELARSVTHRVLQRDDGSMPLPLLVRSLARENLRAAASNGNELR